jgi:hypothetical protein
LWNLNRFILFFKITDGQTIHILRFREVAEAFQAALITSQAPAMTAIGLLG